LLFFLLFLPENFTPTYVENGGRLLPGSVRNDKEQVRTLIRSVLYFSPSSVINLRFFHGQVE